MVGARGADPGAGPPPPRPVCSGLEQGLLREVRDGTAWPAEGELGSLWGGSCPGEAFGDLDASRQGEELRVGWGQGCRRKGFRGWGTAWLGGVRGGEGLFGAEAPSRGAPGLGAGFEPPQGVSGLRGGGQWPGSRGARASWGSAWEGRGRRSSLRVAGCGCEASSGP